MPVLSIIIPVYNVYPYIRRCLESCINQNCSYIDYEIIIINDGTKDKSMDIVYEYANLYPNIIIINQENKGLSAARNIGRKVANGKYLWFVDSDDWINKDAIRLILETIKLNPEVIVLNYTVVYDKTNEYIDVIKSSYKTGKELLNNDFNCQVQFYVYNKNFLNINNLYCYEGIYHEDLEFTPRMLYYANNIQTIKKSLYFFCRRANSITTTVNPKRSYDYVIVASRLYEFCKNKPDARDLIMPIATRAIINAFNLMSRNSKYERKIFLNYIHSNEDCFTILSSSKTLIEKLRGYIIKNIPTLYYSIYKHFFHKKEK